MNDRLYEQLVVKKSKFHPTAVRILVIALVLLLLFVGPFYLGFLSPILAVVLGLAAFFYIFPHLNVEYEYALLNHDLDISVIYNQSRRAELQSFDIQKAEMIAPLHSDKLSHFQPKKTYDYSSGTNNNPVYVIIISLNQTLCAIRIEPDDRMLQDIKYWMGSRFSNS